MWPSCCDLVGADVLRDPAGLAGRHLGLADRVQQRGLAVVDVAHDRHHRRALDEILVGVVEHRIGDLLVLGVDDLDLLAELGRQHLDRLVRQRLRLASSSRPAPSASSSPRARDVEVLGDVLDGRAGVDLDRRRVRRRRPRGPRLGLFVVDAATPPAAALAPRRLVGLRAAAGAAGAARSLGVDHHAAPAAGVAGGALALQRVTRRARLLAPAPSAPAALRPASPRRTRSAGRRSPPRPLAMGGLGLGGGLAAARSAAARSPAAASSAAFRAARARRRRRVPQPRPAASGPAPRAFRRRPCRPPARRPGAGRGHRAPRGARAIAGRGHGHRRLLGRLDPRRRRRLARRRRPRGEPPRPGSIRTRFSVSRTSARVGPRRSAAAVAAAVGQHAARHLLVDRGRGSLDLDAGGLAASREPPWAGARAPWRSRVRACSSAFQSRRRPTYAAWSVSWPASAWWASMPQ